VNVSLISKGSSRAVVLVTAAMLLVCAAGFSLPVPLPPPWGAVAFLAAGLALVAGPPRSPRRRVFTEICAAAVLLIGITGWCEYAFGLNPGIDRLLFPQLLLKNAAFPGRPGLLACLNLIFLGVELALVPMARKPFAVARDFCGVFAIALSYLGVENFLFRTRQDNAPNAMWPVAAALCIVCALNALYQGEGGRLLRLLRDRGPGGEFARWLLPLPLVFPLVNDSFRLLLRSLGLYGSHTGFVLSSFDIIVPVYILWVSSAQVFRVDRKRREAEEELRKSRDQLEERVQLRTGELLAVNRQLEVAAARRNLAQQELQRLNTILASIIEACPLAICAFQADGSVRRTNAIAAALLGSGELESGEIKLSDIVRRAASGEQMAGLEVTAKAGASSRVFSLWASPLTSPEGKNDGVVVMAADISGRKALELQVRLTQKLESLGVLAGGIAHDFNNLLTSILGNTSLAHDMLPASNPIRGLLEQAVAGSNRAAGLTRQLLAYAGKGQFVIGSIDLSKLVREISSLIQSSIGKNVELRLELADDLPPIQADSSQIQQVVMNLVINGAEAITGHGSVLVRTGSEWIGRGGDPSALHAVLEVIDTGTGMDAETQQRIFDPFFTTKFTGRGLGLAAVQGIVRAHKGVLEVVSSPGNGTAFKILFPAADPVAEEHAGANGTDDQACARDGSGAILVIDDEAGVLAAATSALTAHGYHVESAANGEAGLAIFSRKRAEIRTVLLDLTMPGIGGEETFRRLKHLDADVPVVLSSGYSESEIFARFSRGELAGFLQKPYSSAQLLREIAAAVRDGTGGRSSIRPVALH
jgi:signal transduction histidine kinase/ActR/RegA family two-component response regulator